MKLPDTPVVDHTNHGAFPPDYAACPAPQQRWEADRIRELILEEGMSAFEAQERAARESEGRPWERVEQ